MVSGPLVSILMPTHTRVDVIGFAIQSVLAQTMGDFELLVVGDGCVAGTAEVVASFDDPRIRFFDLPKAPYFGYANRNVALRESRGKYIGFAADDDLLFPDHLERLLSGQDAGGALAYSQALWVSTDGIAAPFLTNLTATDELNTFLQQRNSIPASCFLYRADGLPVRDVWPEDVASAADWLLWGRIIRENSSRPIFYCRTPTVLHFSAKRMTSRYARMPEFATALDIADRACWWPTPLRVSIPDGETEQSIYADLMRADPQGWSDIVRSATNDLIARLAWEDIQIVRPAYAENEGQLSAVRAELTELHGQLSTTLEELAEALDLANAFKHDFSVLEDKSHALRLANQQTNELLADANARVVEKSHEIDAMRSTVAWKLHESLQRVLSRFRF
ncbi:glycosyltransferase family 2 protein (plasmid) [Ensifer adhaerens]|uniref:glycosyltransferase family 2 protein n=1 Tax=Ensifer adhaerens TaxID=106592 RepID=UPI0023A9C37E|nr:glycosyltransferase family 2 protein [Ensifer adhaerens]WDZ80919.1 glycosyltransferase family 2 protein [Ensifer adhaerens]